MPRSGPQGVDPTEIFPFKFGETPSDERAYFTVLSWFVFGSGLNWRVLKTKWPAFLTSFDGFDPDKVAEYDERDIDRLLTDATIIRNGRKIVGTIENARQLRAIAADAGRLLAREGILVVELGCGQAAAVSSILAAGGLAPSAPQYDLLGIPRALVARRLP